MSVETVSFEPEDVRSRLPDGPSDRQVRALICAVRNPDASPYEVAHAAGVEYSEVVRALSNLGHGVFVEDGQSPQAQSAERRGANRKAENYAELTDKQRAIVDYRARNDPEFELSGSEVARSINRADRYDLSLDVTAVPTFEREYDETAELLVEERRNILLAQDRLGDGIYDDAERATAAHRLQTRDYLELAGIEAPDENLDSLDRVGEGLPDDILLDMAYESQTTETVRDEQIPECVDESAVEDYLGDDSFDDDDVEPGTAYHGVVNGISGWALWVTIGGDRTDPGDVSGPVPVERLEPFGLTPQDFDVGEDVTVVATGRSNTKDGKVRHRFAYVVSEPADEPQSEGDDDTPEDTGEGEKRDVGLLKVRRDAESVEADPEGVEETAEWLESRPDGAGEELAEILREVDAVTREQRERIEALERENERLREQVDENAEALPTPEKAQELNEAADAVQNADEWLSNAQSDMKALQNRVHELERGLADVAESLQDEGARRRISTLAERVETLESGPDLGHEAEFAQATIDDYLGRDSWGVRDVNLDGEGRHGSTATLTITFEDRS